MARQASFAAGGIVGLRQLAVPIVLALLLPGLASATLVPRGSPGDERLAAAWNPTDAELVRALALVAGHPVGAPPAVPLEVPAGVTLPGMMLHLSARGGQPIAPEDLAPFLALDARVQAPLLLALVTIDRAWDLRDQAFAQLDEAEMRELRALLAAGALDSPRAAELGGQIDAAPLIEAAILLLDTLEGIVIPALMEAFGAGAWPPMAVADPVGFVRLGSGGDDFEDMDRMLQFDPAGDDVYWNNAGGTAILNDIDLLTWDYPIAVSVDGRGDDTYDEKEVKPTFGTGAFGVGIMLDFAGADSYTCVDHCLGGAFPGFGLARDFQGDDSYAVISSALGGAVGEAAIGILRDDAGADQFQARGAAGGYGYRDGALGLLWDRTGTDRYSAQFGPSWMYGWGGRGGRGWLVDESSNIDYYAPTYACNDCTWVVGTASPITGEIRGHGDDNRRGLAGLIGAELAEFP